MSISHERLNELCRIESPATFFESCGDLPFRDLLFLQSEISSRLTVTESQIENHINSRRDVSKDWERRATIARDMLARKSQIVATRINAARDLSLASLGGLAAGSSRLAMIKFLLGLIGSHLDPAELHDDERIALDACHAVTEAPLAKYGRWEYDHAAGRVYEAATGLEIARIRGSGYARDEAGNLAAAAPKMADLLASYQSIATSRQDRLCLDRDVEGHDAADCRQCCLSSLWVATREILENV